MWKPVACYISAGLQAAIEQDIHVYYILSNGLVMDIKDVEQLRKWKERHKELCTYDRDRWSMKEWELRSMLPNPYLELVRTALQLHQFLTGLSGKRLLGPSTTVPTDLSL